MTRTPTQYEQFAAANLVRPGGKGAWATGSESFCVEAVWYFGGFPSSFDNASIAANYVLQHHGLDPDYRTAVRGEFHYWGTGAGHITFEAGQLNELMASSFANSLAPGLGYMPIITYGVPVGHGHTYMGHSPYFGDFTLVAEIDPSGGGGTPVQNEGDESMRVLHATNNPTIAYQGVAAGSICWVDGSSGSGFYTGAQLSIAAAEAKVYNGTQTYIDVTGDEMVVAIEWANARKITATGSGVTAAQVQATSDASDAKIEASLTSLGAAIAGDFTIVDKSIAAIPTATQNGAAARTAIVAP